MNGLSRSTLRTLLIGSATVALTLAQTSGVAYAQKKKPDTKAAEAKAAEEKAAAEAKAAEEKAAADKAAEEKAAADKAAEEKAAADKAKTDVEPPREEWDIKDVEEKPGKTYLFIGLRYRGNLIPKFMLNMFVDEGKTVYSNSIGAEFEMRKDGFSLIPALTYTELGTGDILFKEKGSKDIAGNYNLVNSSMKVIYATADLLWSSKISKNLDFEYGAGFGLGVVFGDLVTNWVREDPNGYLHSDSGKRFIPCPTVDAPGTGCNKADHQNSDVDKVGGYTEPSWFGGGSKPTFFPWIAVPQIGLRFKPIKQFVGRLGLGFSLTGFWFGVSGQYGLEKERKD
jgi:hypothetical protein